MQQIRALQDADSSGGDFRPRHVDAEENRSAGTCSRQASPAINIWRQIRKQSLRPATSRQAGVLEAYSVFEIRPKTACRHEDTR